MNIMDNFINIYSLKKIVPLILLLLSSEVFSIDHVIHISVDGLSGEAVRKNLHALPNINALKAKSYYTYDALTDRFNSITLPNHASQFTGYPVYGRNGHKWIFEHYDRDGNGPDHNNPRDLSSIPNIFESVSDAGYSSSLFAGKQKFNLFEASWGNDIGRVEHRPSSSQSSLTAAFISDLASTNREYAFLHLTDPDLAGHRRRWNFDLGSGYMNSVVSTDTDIGSVLTFIESTDPYRNNTAIIFTADHGGTPGRNRHDQLTHHDIRVPFFVYCPNLNASIPFSNQIQNGDVANAAAKLLGIPVLSGSTFNNLSEEVYETCLKPRNKFALTVGAIIQMLLNESQ